MKNCSIFPGLRAALKKVGQKQCFGRNLKAFGLCPVPKSGEMVARRCRKRWKGRDDQSSSEIFLPSKNNKKTQWMMGSRKYDIRQIGKKLNIFLKTGSRKYNMRQIEQKLRHVLPFQVSYQSEKLNGDKIFIAIIFLLLLVIRRDNHDHDHLC